jgi:hypothetical protein
MRRPQAIVQVSVWLLALLSLSSCTPGIPGLTASREIYSYFKCGALRLSPDGNRLAYATYVAHARIPIGLGLFPDGGGWTVVGGHADVYVYDLVRHGPPKRVFTQEAPGYLTWCDLSRWGEDGVLLVVKPWDGNWEHILIDPDHGTSRALGAVSGDSLSRALAGDSGDYSWYVRHGHLEAMQVYLWHPDTCTDEWLFDFPFVFDGYPLHDVGSVFQERRVYKYRQSIHRIQGMTVSAEKESLRVRVRTYVPLAGTASRSYQLSFSFYVPGADSGAPGASQERPPFVVTTIRKLGPSGTDVVQALPMAKVREILGPYVRADAERGLSWFGAYVSVSLSKMPEASDQGMMRNRWSVENGSGLGFFKFPISKRDLWPAPSQWKG